jgi:hypothetical protein
MSTSTPSAEKRTDDSIDSNNPNAIADAEFLDAVAELAAAGDTDIGGGVSLAAVADAVDCAECTARTRLADLVDAGELTISWGMAAIGSQPRRGFLPRGVDK